MDNGLMIKVDLCCAFSKQKSGTFGRINPYSDRGEDSLRSFIIEIEQTPTYFFTNFARVS